MSAIGVFVREYQSYSNVINVVPVTSLAARVAGFEEQHNAPELSEPALCILRLCQWSDDCFGKRML